VISAAAEAMRAVMVPVEHDFDALLDTCGTGGDGSHTLNLSTGAAIFAAAAGARVAKHGNRAVSSKSGSADVMEALGVKIDLTPEQVGRCIDEVGVGFMFAPAHHRALKHASAARKELGTRTIFNLVAPLTNPASAPNQVIGVFAPERMEMLARVLQQLGSRHVMLVHADGLDELSIAGPSEVVELKGGRISRFRIEPKDFGISVAPLDRLVADSPSASLGMLNEALDEPDSTASQIVALNAGAAIYVCGVATSFANGVTMAQDAIASGLAKERLAELVRLTAMMGETG